MGKARRGRPTRELHTAVPRFGSNAPFLKERRHVAVNKILRGGLSYNAASKHIAALVKANYVDNGSVDARALAARSIRRWTAQVVLHGRTSALSPSGRPLRLTEAEDEFVLGWAREMKFFTQVCLPVPAPRPEPCAPRRCPAIDALCTSLPQPTAGKRGRVMPFVTSPLKCLTHLAGPAQRCHLLQFRQAAEGDGHARRHRACWAHAQGSEHHRSALRRERGRPRFTQHPSLVPPQVCAQCCCAHDPVLILSRVPPVRFSSTTATCEILASDRT